MCDSRHIVQGAHIQTQILISEYTPFHRKKVETISSINPTKEYIASELTFSNFALVSAVVQSHFSMNIT